MSIIFILFFNLTIVIFNFYLVWKLLKFKRYLELVNCRLNKTNLMLPLTLSETSMAILLTALEVKNIKSNYIQIVIKTLQIKQLISLLNFIYKLQ